ncbi:helix-turn-helix transcriptional regulator [Glycocaulis profundi]|nr:helix-turn-helix transcriptional regulator [Glycocaulis profundi]
MTEPEAAARLSALAHEARLKIFRALVAAGPEGLPAGRLAEAVEVAPSNLSAHLAVLAHAGLTRVRPEGRHRIWSVDLEAVAGLVGFLVDDCCQGRPEVCAPLTAIRPSC